MKNKNQILNISLIGLFAAISYISLMLFFFPVGPMFVHFGNLIVVLAALLIGGWQGGLSGAIGMGLYDLFNGHADSAPKTLLLKFLIGFTVRFVFTTLSKRLKSQTLCATVGAVLGMVVNIIGEFLWKTVQYYLAGSAFKAAAVASLLSQGSTLLNAVIAIIGGVALFVLLRKPFSKILSKQ